MGLAPAPPSLVERVGRDWEWIKLFGLTLWPIRFIVLVTLAMIAILSLSQGKDALYGAVVEGDRRWWFYIGVWWWAGQTWYWARFLFDRVLPRTPFFEYLDSKRVEHRAAQLRSAIPRCLGALVFVIVGFFVWQSSCGSACEKEGSAPLLWALWYGVLSAAVFLALTIARRKALQAHRATSPAAGDEHQEQRQAAKRVGRAAAALVSPTVRKLAAAAVLTWGVLLIVGLISALWELSPRLQQSIGVLFVLVLAVLGLVLAVKLPLPFWTRVAVVVLSLCNTVLFTASMFSAAAAGQLFGPAIVLMLTAGLWVGATSFFVAYPGEKLRLPVATLIVAAALVFGFMPKFVPPWFGYAGGDYDNHAVRTIAAVARPPVPPPVPPSVQPASGGAAPPAGLAAAFRAWKSQAQKQPCVRAKAEDPCLTPMILISVEGGASRSGYWAANVLGALQDAFGDRGFHRSIFAISSVSGGSLGAAVYQRLVARKQRGAGASAEAPLCTDKDRGSSNSFAVCGARVLETDFLGPAFFSMFNADLLQRLFPGDIMPDRATALETAWERTWQRETGSADFAEPFRLRDSSNLTSAGENDWLPVLLLNGASVKTGRRIMTSDIRLDPECQSNDANRSFTPDLPSTLDFFCLTRRPIRLSTAVHNSARFPYISPAGTLWAEDSKGNRWKADRIVDGGYVEAQGATTLIDLVTTLSLKVPDWRDGVLPILITIQNDRPTDGPDCTKHPEDMSCPAVSLGDEAKPMGWAMRIANDLLAPPIGLADGRSGRGEYAARALEVAVYADAHRAAPAAAAPPGTAPPGTAPPGTAPPTANTAPTIEWSMYRFNLLAGAGPEPAMSWYLSRRSQIDMARDLCVGGAGNSNLDQAKALGEAFGLKSLDARVEAGDGCQVARAKAATPTK